MSGPSQSRVASDLAAPEGTPAGLKWCADGPGTQLLQTGHQPALGALELAAQTCRTELLPLKRISDGHILHTWGRRKG